MNRVAITAVMLSALMLCGCNNDASKQSVATGEILPGSISDAMVPEDQLTSQPPLAPQTARAAKKDATPDATGAASDQAAPEAAPADQPAAADAPQ